MKNSRRSRAPPGTCENSGSPPPPRRPCHVAQGILHRTLFPLTRMQPHKSVLLHSHLHPSIFPTARVEQPDLAPAKSTTTAPKDKSHSIAFSERHILCKFL